MLVFVVILSLMVQIPSDSTTTYMILSLQGDMATTTSFLNPINLEASFLSLSVAVAVSVMMCACSGLILFATKCFEKFLPYIKRIFVKPTQQQYIPCHALAIAQLYELHQL